MRLEFGGSVKDDLDQMIRDAHRQSKKIKKIHLTKRELFQLEQQSHFTVQRAYFAPTNETVITYLGIEVEVHE